MQRRAAWVILTIALVMSALVQSAFGQSDPLDKLLYLPSINHDPTATFTATPSPTATATRTPTPTRAGLRECSTSDPNWRGSNPAYTFCVATDLNWIDDDSEVRNFSSGQNLTLTAEWDIYGIAGIWFIVEPSSQICGPSGTSLLIRQTVGTGSESFNVKDFDRGSYRAHLRIKRSSDGAEVDFSERFLCIGTGLTTPTPTVEPSVTPLPLVD